MRCYAHVGSSSANAFETYDGFPVRFFIAFDTKRERQEYQDKVWEESSRKKNVIFCSRKFVERWFGRDFYVANNDVIYQAFMEGRIEYMDKEDGVNSNKKYLPY